MAPEITSEKKSHETRHERRAWEYGLTGPILLLALGVIFLVGEFVPGWGVSKSWPVVLIAIGIAKLLESICSRGPTPRG